MLVNKRTSTPCVRQVTLLVLKKSSPIKNSVSSKSVTMKVCFSVVDPILSSSSISPLVLTASCEKDTSLLLEGLSWFSSPSRLMNPVAAMVTADPESMKQ